MSKLDAMRALLGRGETKSYGPSKEDQQVLLEGHQEFMAARQTEALETQARALEPILSAAGKDRDDRTGDAVLATFNALRVPDAGLVAPPRAHDDDCRELVSRFFIESPVEDVRNNSGNVLRFSRANAGARTLEIAAATGEFGGVRWPSSEQFILGLNRATATLGGVIDIPQPQGPLPALSHGSILTVEVEFSIDYVLFDGTTTPAPGASPLLHALKSSANLPLRGTAVGKGRAGLSLHGSGSSSATGIEFVSAWANRDGSDSEDLTVNGRFTLSHTVALGTGTSSVAVFVDATCFSLAEETDEPFQSAFTVFECRNKPLTEVTGSYVYPARLRLSRVDARLCELPIVLRADPGQPA